MQRRRLDSHQRLCTSDLATPSQGRIQYAVHLSRGAHSTSEPLVSALINRRGLMDSALSSTRFEEFFVLCHRLAF